MMLVDAHQHFWSPSRGDYTWMHGNEGVASIARDILPRHLEPTLKKHGITRTVLVQAAESIEETEYMLGLADATEWIGKVVGWINFEDKSHLKHLERFAKHPKFAGLRPMIQDIPDPDWMLRRDVQWAYEAIIANDLTFDALGFPVHLARFHEIFTRYPTMRAVIDHGMKPVIRNGEFDDWAKAIIAIAETTQVHCKLSGLANEAGSGWTPQSLAPYVAHLLKSFGHNRLMWGSDWPVLELAGSYDNWLATARALIPPADAPAIFGGTAARFYRLA
jgi:L-fuconolactonase